MKMVKGYTLPSPDAGDGEYGGFAEYASSPAVAPYWAGGNPAALMAKVPALDGVGACHGCGYGADPLATEGTITSKPALMALAGAGAGVLLSRNPVFVLLGAAAGYAFGKTMQGTSPLEKAIQDARERAEEASLDTRPASQQLASFLPYYTDDTPRYRQQLEVPGFASAPEEKPLGGLGAIVGIALLGGLFYVVAGE
jgi:hypothetical protein